MKHIVGGVEFTEDEIKEAFLASDVYGRPPLEDIFVDETKEGVEIYVENHDNHWPGDSITVALSEGRLSFALIED